MNYKVIFYMLGTICKIVAVLLLIPFILSLCYMDSAVFAFSITIGLFLLIGFAMAFKRPKDMKFYAKEGLIIVGLAWIIISVIGCLPFFISRAIPSFVDSLFETVSGFTTTGSTILTEIETLPKSLLFWRSFTHWIGGMGILVFILAIMPVSGSAIHIFRSETPGITASKLNSKMTLTARFLYITYSILTLVEIVFLLFGGLDVFNSVTVALSTAGTGGFSVLNNSIAGYNSVYVEMVVTIFMFLFGINFSLYYLIFIGKILQAFKNEELITYCLIVVLSTLAIAININYLYESFAMALKDSVFQVVSIITTTGFATVNHTIWPTFSQTILVFLMFTGGCAGSTCGGLKICRLSIVSKSSIISAKKFVNPRGIYTVKMDGKALSEDVLTSTRSYFILYILLIMVSTFLLSLDKFTFTENFTASITSFSNVGPGLGKLGAGNFVEYSIFSKFLLIFNMLIGRMEIYPILLLFSPRTWTRK